MPKILELSKYSLDRFIVNNPALPTGYIRSPYYNGLGRHVCQLQRITFKFCKTSGTSKGVRQFIETDLVDWSRANPGVAVYLKPRRHRGPVITTEYLNGMNHWMWIREFTPTEIMWWLNYLKNRSGYEVTQLLSPVTVTLPSVQGPWNPFLNRPTELNVKSLPDSQRGQFIPRRLTASEQLIEITKELKGLNVSK